MNNTTSTCKKSLAAMLLSAVIALAGCAAQNGNLTPAETRQLFKAFERGVRLTRECQGALEAAETKVEILLQQAGGESLQAFDDELEEADE